MKSKLRSIYIFFIAISFIHLFSACEKDTPEIPPALEVITTVRYTLSPMDGSDPTILLFQDLDGDSGMAPIVMGGTLATTMTYNGTIEFLNESVTPMMDITEEVLEEGVDHQVFYESKNIGFSVAYADSDTNGQPIGLETTVIADNPGTGSLTITLRHEPKKSAENVANGDITNAEGETDVEVVFDIEIK